MLRAGPRVFAIGGGGFTHGSDRDMEDFLLSRLGPGRPHLGFIGTASRDDPVKIRRFHERFAGVCASHTHLPMGADAEQARDWLRGLDLVYVGGGNTLHLVAHWRATGIDQVMVAAAQRGVLMAGVSAGANVWFARSLSDSSGQGLAPTDGIGLLAGSCCPHYSTEQARQPAFVAHIGRGELPAGIAIDDGAAVLVEPLVGTRVFASRPGTGAYHVSQVDGQVQSEPVAPFTP